MTTRAQDQETLAGAALPLQWYSRDTVTVAKDLLGKVLQVRHDGGWRSGAIVEDEAYVAHDPANHAYRGKSAKNKSMFSGPGTVYVYAIHGVFCTNVVTLEGEAVLIRALEPVEGIVLPTNGPGKLSRALGISRRKHDGLALTGPEIRISNHDFPSFQLGVSRRIGVRRAIEKPLRFFVEDNPFVSR